MLAFSKKKRKKRGNKFAVGP